MAVKLKPLHEQVIVITGATSGIGLATATRAAAEGASVVLAARSEQALDQISQSLRDAGHECVGVVCDVAVPSQVEHLANEAVSRFGRIDTWVNNAGVSIYGRLDRVAEADSRRLFDTNFWGVCNGSFAALPHLRRSGGALINVGSEVSEAYIPLQGMYTASKHAVKGFTDSLRVEVEEIDEAPVAITLIEPTAVDTPFPQHARNYMAHEPRLPDPMIEPSKVADAILDAAVNPTREKRVGMLSKLNTTLAKLAPGIADKISAKQYDRQQYDEPPRNRMGALYDPSESTGVVATTHGTGGHSAD